jgi:hypothetical protein
LERHVYSAASFLYRTPMAGPMECAFLGEGDVIDYSKERDDEILIQIH